jgi:hypothetical protein
MIIAIAALIAALAGTAIAASVSPRKFRNFRRSTNTQLAALAASIKSPVVYVNTTVNGPSGGGDRNTRADCPAATKILGGGIRVSDPSSSYIEDSFPTPFGWAGSVYLSSSSQTAITTAICATVPSSTGTPPNPH